VVLASYFVSVKLANCLATANAILLIGASIIFIGVWAVAAGIFHKNLNGETGFNLPNIWSWSCSHEDASDAVVNFKQICLTQVLLYLPLTQGWSFICAMIEIALELLTIGSFLLILVRRRSKRELRKSEHYSVLMKSQYPVPPTGYEQQGATSRMYEETGIAKPIYPPEKEVVNVA
jgi:hypothetical protein